MSDTPNLEAKQAVRIAMLRRDAYKETAAQAALADLHLDTRLSIEFTNAGDRFVLDFGRDKGGKHFAELRNQDNASRGVPMMAGNPEEIIQGLARVPRSLDILSHAQDRLVKKATYKRAQDESAFTRSISGSLDSLLERRDDLVYQARTMRRLIKAAEARRLGRISGIEPITVNFDGQKIQAKMKGRTNDYNTRISIRPQTGHICTCPDWKRNGRRVGPCKHVLALGTHWLETKVLPTMGRMDRALLRVLDGTDLII